MTVTSKVIDITKDNLTEQEWAEGQKGIWMNMLGGCRYDAITGKYNVAPIKYSDANLEGEKVKFSSGQEFEVIYSCLAQEYKNNKAVYDEWWKNAKKLVDDYKEQQQIAAHIKSTNSDLKKLRQEGALLDDEKK